MKPWYVPGTTDVDKLRQHAHASTKASVKFFDSDHAQTSAKQTKNLGIHLVLPWSRILEKIESLEMNQLSRPIICSLLRFWGPRFLWLFRLFFVVFVRFLRHIGQIPFRLRCNQWVCLRESGLFFISWLSRKPRFEGRKIVHGVA
jgi:hypothetical protein